ncbi:hypothetical protein L596_019038 [Steinernema carpocapsae]|uniref:Uncharacterized protein n=1 Tax=Steinernema carpocapsae TaxID=34508 RepID=A0A4U5N6M7_STECR|nr:hypothetical protein L596_019038 [Steinernema carpocapsae]
MAMGLAACFAGISSKEAAKLTWVTLFSAVLNFWISTNVFNEQWMISLIEGNKWAWEKLGDLWFDDGQKITKMYELWPPHKHFGFYAVFSVLCYYFMRYRTTPTESLSTAFLSLRMSAISGFVFTSLLLPVRIGEFHIFVLALNLLHVLAAPQVVLVITKSTEFFAELVPFRTLEKTKTE